MVDFRSGSIKYHRSDQNDSKSILKRHVNRLINFDFLTTKVWTEFFYFCGKR